MIDRFKQIKKMSESLDEEFEELKIEILSDISDEIDELLK